MDGRAASAIATVSEAAESLCGLSHIEKKMGKLARKTSQPNSQIKYRIFTRRVSVKAFSTSRSQLGSGDPSRVDAEMIVLRKRIQELRMQEANYLPPQHWMKWEKDWSVTYVSDVCQFMGWLQNMLYNTRPALAIAAFALISVSFTAFVLFLLSQFFQVSAPYIALAMEFVTKALDP